MSDDINPQNDPENAVQYQRNEPFLDETEQFDYEKHGLVYFKKRHGQKKEICLTDQDVVPYNEFLTLKYGTHINIEYVFGQKACKYIFKYILKGNFTSYFELDFFL